MVLFACVRNAGRSQIAAAFFNALSDPGRARALSAGSEPAAQVHPEVVAAMKEIGIDLSAAPTTRLTEALARQADVLVTMGCGDECPIAPGVIRDDWPVDDPHGRSLDDVRRIREEICRRVEALIDARGWR